MAKEFIPDEIQLRSKIHILRGVQVMLDRDLASSLRGESNSSQGADQTQYYPLS